MNTIVEIDRSGRIVVPKKFRDALQLKPGTRLKLEQAGERLVLEQDSPEPRLGCVTVCWLWLADRR